LIFLSNTSKTILEGTENITRGNMHFLEEGAYFARILDNEIDGIKTQKQLAKIFGISQQDVSYKLQVHRFLFTNIGKSSKDIGIDLPILVKNDKFGLTHALELTRLHHDNIVIEEREEGDKTLKLGFSDLLKEVIEDKEYIDDLMYGTKIRDR